jgi:hypothetical protein
MKEELVQEPPRPEDTVVRKREARWWIVVGGRKEGREVQEKR